MVEGFQVRLEDPEKIHQMFTLPEYQNQVVFLGGVPRLEEASSLFSRIACFAFPVSDGGFTMDLLVRYRKYEYGYWSTQEVDRLMDILKSHYPVALNPFNEDKGISLVAPNQLEEDYVVILGWRNAEDHWKEQVRSYERVLEFEEHVHFTGPGFSYLPGTIPTKDKIAALIASGNPKENDIYDLQIIFKSSDISQRFPEHLPLEEVEKFVEQLYRRCAFVERVINGVSLVKNIPQPGMLVIKSGAFEL